MSATSASDVWPTGRRYNALVDIEDGGGAFARAARSEHLFVVRVWREPGAGGSGQWRGVVDDVTSGQRRYFAATSDLVEFILRSVEEVRR